MLTTRASRLKFGFSADFFRPDGHVILSNLAAARAFAAQMSARCSEPVSTSELYALSLLDEAYHIILKHFYGRYTGVMGRAMGMLQSSLGSKYDLTLGKFTDEYPPTAVFRGEVTAGVYLSKAPNASDFGRGRRAATIEEMLLVNNSNSNPAVKHYRELFDESVMKGSAYREFVQSLLTFYSQQPGLGNGEAGSGESITEILQAPIKASPDSLEGQLRFIIEKWGYLLGETFSLHLLRGLDFLREDTIRKRGPIGSQKAEVYVPNYFGNDYAEYERYSVDKDWMPRLVLIAKNTYVWLSQLSKKYQRNILTLDQIPDEELDLLASRGFTGLWLIGLWERSRASQRIKQRMGQHDAVASAYSLHSYDIANDLGGWNALNNLRFRAWGRGIRLSADMVPNHMGIDSNWVVEHPDWFLSSSFSPYPSYNFNSENLSDDLRAAIVLEDHYYNHSDASVVFKFHNYQTNETRYIYHGNDGTSFPWNDTAQLDFTNPVVREAVIQVILHVARNFPIIRFDAAMTLAKKHIQRLWFPEPGMGGAIPSRSQYGMTKFEFDEKIPEEFWREVVDRVAKEVPDTLLLAEAFWLMEGYFVRTLGMHRVYNSAFMHMLRDEDNAKYRLAIKNTLEFDPQILKRYVNFMNNPDEKTAVEQFGNGDKYFGICTVLSTLPGLPMFGHGQVEGFKEKYGMEFRVAKWEETPDEGLVRGHEWRIFPLLHRRHLFADVEQFQLYDFYVPNGSVDENVFAYSNRFNDPSAGSHRPEAFSGGRDERGLVVYHNKFGDTRGWIHTSAAALNKASGKLVQKNLAAAIGLPHDGFAIFKDYVTQLEYIRPCRELWKKGLYVELGAYQCHVFMDWRFVGENEWKPIYEQLNGRGVPSMQDEWRRLYSIVEHVKVEEKPARSKKVRPVHKSGLKRMVVQSVKGEWKKLSNLTGEVKVEEESVKSGKARAARKAAAKTKKAASKKVTSKKEKAVVARAKAPAASSTKEKKVVLNKTQPTETKPAAAPAPKAKKPAAPKTKPKTTEPKKVVAKKPVTKKIPPAKKAK